MGKIYLKFAPAANINYPFLFKLLSVAKYNIETKSYWIEDY